MAKWLFDHAVTINNIDDFVPKIAQARGYGAELIEQLISPDYDIVYALSDKLPDIKKAVRRLKIAIEQKQKIVIYGDYDIDGVSATTLLHGALLDAGANTSYYVPDRFEEGYGLNSDALLSIAGAGAQLVITVDCGITSIEEIRIAKARGLDVIVTDHHSLADDLPSDAIALINPKRTPKSPLYDLAGVGVAFMLVLALQKAEAIDLPQGREKWLLDLVALGTICDVVPLSGVNRLLAYYGIKVMQKSKRPGIKALADVADVKLVNINASDIGFRFGPRLNSAGRLEHAEQAIELLLSKDYQVASSIADKLQSLNRDRQILTEAIYNEAVEMLSHHQQDKVIVLSSENWSHGIVGIVASRLVERTNKPVILMHESGEIAKGSARSPKNFNIIKAVSAQAELLDRFGGHAYAAGMSLKVEHIERFRRGLNDYATTCGWEVVEPDLVLDAVVLADLLTLESYHRIQSLGPFGQANAEPILTTRLMLYSFKFVGRELKHLQLRFKIGDDICSAIAFFATDKWPWLKEGEMVEVAFRLDENIWQDQVKLQLMIEDMRQCQ